jgi:hypothetical protein
MTDHAILALLLGAHQQQQKSGNQRRGASAKCLIRQKDFFDTPMTPR